MLCLGLFGTMGMAAGSGVELSWNIIPGADLYRIYRNGWYTGVARTNSFKDESLDRGRMYKYAVQAVTVHGEESRKSKELKFETGAAKEQYLNDLSPDHREQSYGHLHFNETVGAKVIQLGDKKYDKGLGVHAESKVIYTLNGYFRWFTAVVGADIEANGTVEFLVFCDGTERFKSGLMTSSSEPRHLDIDLSQVNELKLVVTDGGNGIGGDHADWADAKIK